MMRERIASLVLRAYPRPTRLLRGPEMLSMLLEAGEQSRLEFVRECASLLIGGLSERSHASRRRVLVIAAGTIAAALALVAIATGLNGSSPAQNMSNVRRLLSDVGPSLRHGDLVLVADPELKSLTHQYLPNDLRYATPLGLYNHPRGRGHQAHASLVGSYSRDRLKMLLTTLAPGQHVLLIRPVIGANASWRSPQTQLERRLAAQLEALLAQDPKLRPVTLAPPTQGGLCCSNDSGSLYVNS